MAAYPVFKPPKAFDFQSKNPNKEWRTWKREFQIFIGATGGEALAAHRIRDMFLASIGPDGIEVFDTFEFLKDDPANEGQKVPNEEPTLLEITNKFDDFFEPKKNSVFERYKFWSISQNGNSIDKFYTELCTQVKHCEFKEKDEMIRDKIIFSITNKKVQERLLRSGEIDLIKVLDICRAAETSQAQMKVIQKDKESDVMAIGTGSKNKNRRPSSKKEYGKPDVGYKPNSNEYDCRKCGTRHGQASCPAFGRSCKKCGKQNHFTVGCFSRTSNRYENNQNRYPKRASKLHNIEQSETESDSEDDFSIDFIQCDEVSNDKKENTWKTKLTLFNNCVSFKIDTGSQVDIVPLKVFEKLDYKPELEKTSKVLSTYGNFKIEPTGQFQALVGSQMVKFLVTDVGSCPILGLDTSRKLGLINKHESVQVSVVKKVKVANSKSTRLKIDKSDSKSENLKSSAYNNKSAKNEPKNAQTSNDDTNKSAQSGNSAKATKEGLIATYKENFTGLGKMNGVHHIVTDPNIKPVIHPPRKVPFTVKDKLKAKLNELIERGVIRKVDRPTRWVNSLVVVEKSNKDLRLCLDPKQLNKAIQREHHKIPTPEEIATEMAGKKVFSVLDLKDAFWQVELDQESADLCTFSTVFGRFQFLRLPFGIKSATEILQRKMEEIFGDIEGIHIIHDDVIVAGKDDNEHDEIMKNLMIRATENNVKFNGAKLQYKVDHVKYCGNIISAEGLKVDPDKIVAINEMIPPSDKQGVQRLLGTVNYLRQFIPNMSEVSEPLRILLKKDVAWHWDHQQQESFDKIKELLTSSPVLQYFNVNGDVVLQSDASKGGLGSVILQGNLPVAYSSRSLKPAEVNYAPIELELLGIVTACEKFHQYIYGKDIEVNTDHKPLIGVFNKPLNSAPPRLQAMLLRLQKYSLTLKYIPGKDLHIPDTLSRASLIRSLKDESDTLHQEGEHMIHSIRANAPITEKKAEEFRTAYSSDPDFEELSKQCKKGWPQHIKNVPQNVRCYWPVKDELHQVDGLFFKGDKIIVPKCLREEMLIKIHESHLGIVKCKSRARSCLYWPRLNEDIEMFIQKCKTCNKHANKNIKEPLLPHEVPDRAWQKIGMDIFTIGDQDFLVVIDYWSRYPELEKLNFKTAREIISKLKPMFARHGIPEVLIADNMPFGSAEMREFAKNWEFEIVTSSPRYPKSNGLAERNVQTLKKLLKKAIDSNGDTTLVLLNWRTANVTGTDLSPAELLMNRRLRTRLPVKASLLEPKISKGVKQTFKNLQEKAKSYYDIQAKSLSMLRAGEKVRYQKGSVWLPAIVVARHHSPRSYLIRTESKHVLRRNRHQLKSVVEDSDETNNDSSGSDLEGDDPVNDNMIVHPEPLVERQNINNDEQLVPEPNINNNEQLVPEPVRTQSGRVVRNPDRYGNFVYY